jgi:hypothetical protein
LISLHLVTSDTAVDKGGGPEVKLKIICPRKEEHLAAAERRNFFYC